MTTLDDLYQEIGAVVTEATERKWWKKAGIQGVPKEGYSTIFLDSMSGLQHDVTETVDVAEGFAEQPWGTALIPVKIEFFKDDALTAAHKLRASLRYTKRFYDLWKVCGLISAINVVDVSGAFRADIEPRAEVRFMVQANISAPADPITDIETLQVDVTHVQVSGDETDIPVTFENAEN